MIPPKISKDEAGRLAALHRYEVLDTESEQAFDDFTALAAHICETPIALLSLVDGDRQWFKSRVGIDATETPRDVAFCGHAIHQRELFVVADARADERFHDNPLVTGPPQVRFYAGAPLETPDGHLIGTLCVIDHEPRVLSAPQRDALARLGRQVIARLEHRLALHRIAGQAELQAKLMANLPAAVISTDARGRITSFSRGAEQILGDRAEDIVGQSLSALMRPRDQPGEASAAAELERLAQIARASKHEAIETRCVRRDGSEVPVLLSVTALRDERAKVAGYLGIAQDLSERRAAESTIQRSAAEIHALYNTVPCGYHSLDRGGVFVNVNDTALGWLGYLREEVVGRTRFVDLLLPEDRASFAHALERLERQRRIEDLELILVRKDGSRMDALLSAAMVADDAGRFTHSRWTLVDITARKRVEEERDRFFDLSLDLLAIAGVDGYFRRVNPAFTATLGHSSEALLEGPFLDFVHPEDRAATVSELARLGGGAATIAFENRYRCADGTWKWLSWNAQPSPKDGLVFAVARDVTALKRSADALRASEQRLAVTLRSINEGVLTTDAAGRVTLLNSAAERMTGWRSIDAVGRPIDEVLRLLDRDGESPPTRAVDETLRAGAPWSPSEPSRLRAPDGRELVIASSAAPLRDAGGELIGAALVLRDVTEEHASELALRTARERLTFLLSATGAVIYAAAPDGSRGTFVSDNIRSVLGYEPAECLEPAWWASGLHPEDRDRVFATAATVGRVDQVSQQYRFRHRDGRWRWIADDVRVVRDAEGRASELVGAWSDVTERHEERERAELRLRAANDDLERLVIERTAALRENEERFQQLADHSSEGFWFMQLDPRRTLYASPAVANIWRVAPEGFRDDGGPWEAALHPDDRARVVGAFREAAEAGKLFEAEYRVVRPDGSIRWVLDSGTPIRDASGRLHRMAGVVKDITERLRGEEAVRQSLREKEILLKEIHHRVKNNLQIISSLLSLQSDEASDPTTRALLAQSIHRVRSISLIHERLYQSETLARVDLGEYANALANFLVRSFTLDGEVALVVDTEPIEVDIQFAVPCGLILNELISNALKHGLGAGRGSRLEVIVRRAPGGGASLSVRDDGPGLPPGLDLGRASSLGLRLVSSLVRQIKGTLDILDGDGAGFRVTLGEQIHGD